MLFVLASFTLAGEYDVMETYLESVDKPAPGVEVLNIKNISHKSNSGWVCTYKEQLETQYQRFIQELESQRNTHERCNFSMYMIYLFDKKEFTPNLYTMAAHYDATALSPYNIMIRDRTNPGTMTVSFICKDCPNSQELITENIKTFYQNTCVRDAPDRYLPSQIESMKQQTTQGSKQKMKTAARRRL